MLEQSHSESSSSTMYYVVYLALLVLLGVTIAVAEFDLGVLNLAAATVIATIKATLIALFFMHVWHSRPLIWLVAAAGIFWLGILLVLTFNDYLTRA